MENQNLIFDAVVIGAGIGGLSAAWKLASSGKRVLLLDQANHPGGVIQSKRLGGYLLELGPNSYTSFGNEEKAFLNAIGLTDRVLRKPLKTTDRYIWHSNKLHRVPTGPVGFALSPILSLQARLRLLGSLFKEYTKPTRHSSLGNWMRNVVGDELVETLLKPFFGGIYAADVDYASFADCAPALYEAVQNAPKLSRVPAEMKALREKQQSSPAMPKSLTSFPHGLSELPNATAQAFCSLGGVMHLGVTAVVEHSTTGDEKYRVTWGNRPDCVAHTNHLILATPAAASAKILRSVAPESAQILSGFRSVPLNVLHVGLRSRYLSEKRQGFGFLTRRNERVRMLGSIWSSRIFKGRAPEGKTLLTCFYGGELDAQGNDLSDQELKETLLQDLQRTMGFTGPSDVRKAFEFVEVTRWRPALAAYPLGHGDALLALKRSVPTGIQLVSGYLGKPALPDRIKAGWAAADLILQSKPAG